MSEKSITFAAVFNLNEETCELEQTCRERTKKNYSVDFLRLGIIKRSSHSLSKSAKKEFVNKSARGTKREEHDPRVTSGWLVL